MISAYKMLVNKLTMKLSEDYRICQLAIYRYRFKHEVCNFLRNNYNTNDLNSSYQNFVYHEQITTVINTLVKLVINTNKFNELLCHMANYLMLIIYSESKHDLMNNKQYLRLFHYVLCSD